jgi:hypothetical protein
MDLFGPPGFGWSLALFFGAYMVLSIGRLLFRIRTG